MNARKLTCSHHRLDLGGISQPVSEEDAGRARHGQQVGIGCQRIFLQRVLSSIRTLLRVMVLYESHGIAAIGSILIVATYERPVVIVLCRKFSPCAVIGSITHGIAELEVEGGTLNSAIHLRAVNPSAYSLCTVPTLAHGELRCRSSIIHASERGRIAFHHVIAETGIAQVVLQEIEVGLDDGLHVLALMIKVAHAVPSFA